MNKKILLLLFIFTLFGTILCQVSLGYNLEYKVSSQLDSNGNLINYIFRNWTTSAVDTTNNFSKIPEANRVKVFDSNFGIVSFAKQNNVEEALDSTHFITSNLRFHTSKTTVYTESIKLDHTDDFAYASGLVTNTSSLLPGSGVQKKFCSEVEAYTGNIGLVLETEHNQNLRMTLLAMKSSGSNPVYKSNYAPYINSSNPPESYKTKIYISDRYITQIQLNALKEELTVDGKIYVSATTKTKYGKNANGDWSSPSPKAGAKEGDVTSHYNAKDFKRAVSYWSTTINGTNPEDILGIGSFINLYDNILQFPSAPKRTVLVRHLDIANNTIISETIVNSSNLLAVTGTPFALRQPSNVSIASSPPLLGYNEQYQIGIEEDIEIGVLKKEFYSCIGYNVVTNTVYNNAVSIRDTKIRNGQFISIGNIKQLYVPSSGNDVDDYAIIDLYYRKVPPPRTILVRYINMKDHTNIKTFTITPESLIRATPPRQVQRRMSTNQLIFNEMEKPDTDDFQEKWVIPENETMTINAEPLENYQYNGYIYSNYADADSANALTQCKISQQTIKNSGAFETSIQKNLATRPAGTDDKYIYEMIDFYYSNMEKMELKPLIGKITYAQHNGRPFIPHSLVLPAIVPSSEDLKIGINGAYKYMLGGINVKPNEGHVEKTYSVPYIVSAKMSYSYIDALDPTIVHTGITPTVFKSKSYDYTIPIDYLYYTVPDIRIFTIDKAEIYNKQDTPNTMGLPFLNQNGIKKDIYTIKPNDAYNNKYKISKIDGKIVYKETIMPVTSITQSYSVVLGVSTPLLALGEALRLLDIKLNNQLLAKSKKDVAEYSYLEISANNTRILFGDVITHLNEKTKKVSLGDFADPVLIPVECKTDYPINVSKTFNNPYYPNYPLNPFNEETSQTIMKMEDWAENVFNIPEETLNGQRLVAGKIYYTIKPINVIGADKFNDTEWKKLYKPTDPTSTIPVDKNQTGVFADREKVYTWPSLTLITLLPVSEVQTLNVFTPITVTGKIADEPNAIVNHTNNPDLTKAIIQKNVPFKVICESTNNHSLYSIPTLPYIKEYYVKFDFDVKNVKVSDVIYQNGNTIKANTWIGPVQKDKNYVVAEDATADDLDPSKIWVMGTAINTPPRLIRDIINKVVPEIGLVDDNFNLFFPKYLLKPSAFNISIVYKNRYYSRQDILNISNSIVISDAIKVNSLSRTFDFRVTDLKDINWKNVFRKQVNDNPNVHTNQVYYSGVIKNNLAVKAPMPTRLRDIYEIGKEPKRILPIGPYKNVDGKYRNAPKMGYKFSFDLKTTGRPSIYPDRKIEIEPKFYYISKSGQKLLTKDYNTSSEKIKLFYKNSSGQYIEIGSTNDKYNISFIPKDGYRYFETYVDNQNMLKTKIDIGKLTKITLNDKMMTLSNNETIQTWYGEYKLPNTTIAVKAIKDPSSGKDIYDINKPLKDGYIGVIFDITIQLNATTKLQYGKDNINVFPDPSKNDNTSQWDYEGFMGFIEPGTKVDKLKVKLEKGIWELDNETYNKVKGTVILYDTDSRAANDFE